MPAKPKKTVGKSNRKPVSPLQRRIAALREFALSYPETAEDFPWGDRTIKVRGKIFLFLNEIDGLLAWSLKQPFSGEEALRLPFTKPSRMA